MRTRTRPPSTFTTTSVADRSRARARRPWHSRRARPRVGAARVPHAHKVGAQSCGRSRVVGAGDVEVGRDTRRFREVLWRVAAQQVVERRIGARHLRREPRHRAACGETQVARRPGHGPCRRRRLPRDLRTRPGARRRHRSREAGWRRTAAPGRSTSCRRTGSRCSSIVKVVEERCGTVVSRPHRFPRWGRKSRRRFRFPPPSPIYSCVHAARLLGCPRGSLVYCTGDHGGGFRSDRRLANQRNRDGVHCRRRE